jgi:diguanylate cyclase (GGDEF)-like protein
MADLVTGASVGRNIALNSGNLAAIGAGCMLLQPVSQRDRMLKGQESAFYVLRAILAASLVAGLFGIVVNPLLFGGTSGEGFLFWTATELVNYVTFLPLLLTLPGARAWKWIEIRDHFAAFNVRSLIPLLALVGSVIASVLIGGPGAGLFPMPALLWCGLTYRLFPTACISLIFAVWTLFAGRLGLLWSGADFASRADLISVRLGVSLVAFTPIVVGSLVAARNEVVDRLRFLADHDAMTGLRNRRAFFEAGREALSRCAGRTEPITVMMLDIDHFKSINDRYGHQAGDHILKSFATILKSTVRSHDVVGRIGGEEFAIVLPDCRQLNAILVAQRITHTLRSAAMTIESGEAVRVTVSIGVHVEQEGANLEVLLAHADEALYRAKHIGRDRFELSSALPPEDLLAEIA